MEYSLNTILYLVELQIAEKQQANFIHIVKTYPFCDGAEYKKEVLGYLLKHNNDILNKILNKHREICNAIVEKWNNELRFIGGIKNILDYSIYCSLRKDTNFPFERLELIRNNNGVCEYGNGFIENDRWWGETISFSREDYSTSIMSFNLCLVDFANKVNCFLNDYVSEIDTLQITKEPPPTTIYVSEINISQSTQGHPQQDNLILGKNEGNSELNKEEVTKALEVYVFWEETKSKHRNSDAHKNIFENVSQLKYLDMVRDADFSELLNTGINQRIRYTVFVLSTILGEEWKNKAMEKLGTTVEKIKKHTGFAEYKAMKKQFLQ